MPLKSYQATYGGRDLKAGALLSDPEGGGSATYGPKLDIPVQEFSYTVTYRQIELKADDKTRRVKTVIDKIEGSFKAPMDSFEVEALMLGGEAGVVTGSTPNQSQTYTQKGNQTPRYLELEFQEMDMEEDSTGDLHTVLHKCMVTQQENASTQDSAKDRTYTFMAIARDCDDLLYTKVKNETAVAIATSADTTVPTIASSTYADGATSVPVGAAFAYTFSEAIDIRRISADTVFLQNKTTGTIINTTLSLSANRLTLTVQPTANLAAATQHQVIITRAIADLAGNRLANHAIYDFTTA